MEYQEVVDMTDILDSPEPVPRRGKARHKVIDLLDYPDTPHRSSRAQASGVNTPPLRPSSRSNKPNRPNLNSPITLLDSPYSASQHSPQASQQSSQGYYQPNYDTSFGTSILKSKPTKKAGSSSRSGGLPRMGGYIKPGTGAFGSTAANDSPFSQRAPPRAQIDSYGYDEDGWPAWSTGTTTSNSTELSKAPSKASTRATSVSDSEDESSGDKDGEDFNLDNVQYTTQDFERHHDAEEQMRELLAGAVGDGEDDHGEEGADTIEGFADDMRLMPHQVRGVRWMRERESARKRGGILADDMGLGKTVQTLARIVEGQSEKTAGDQRLYKGGTLIICPLAVMEQWATECRTKTQKGVLKVTTHHGPKRAKTGEELKKYDVVITTFQVLSSEMGAAKPEKAAKATKKKKRTVYSSDSDSDLPVVIKKTRAKPTMKALFDLKWYRVVIDEAQNIKNHKTQAAKAACELQAKYRWCLTGTPIQNNVEELYSLFKFLRAKPLDDWQIFRSRVSAEVKEGRTGVAMKRLHVILKAVMLRRTKTATIDGKPILNLPERNVEVVECEFDSDERAFYQALEDKTALALNKFAKAGTVMSNYTSVLTMLLRLRQACDHPSLVTKTLGVDKDALQNSILQSDESDDAADDLANMMSGLGVSSSKKCEICFNVLENQKAKKCDGCQALVVKALANEIVGELPPSSAKIRMILQLLAEIDERGAKQQKTIIFSQFTSFLNLIEPFLQNSGIKYVRYDGTLRADEREDVLHTIRTSQKTRVILISFKAGSTGLNLTCCNNVILTDLWWNPALEDQAFDRAHRLGQKLDVNIYKLTIAMTVEDRILALQTQKRELAQAALDGTGIRNMKLNLAEIMNLFRTSKPSGDDE